VQGLEKLRLRDVRNTNQAELDALLSSLTNLTSLQLKRGPSSFSHANSEPMQLPTLSHLSSMIKLQVTQADGKSHPSERYLAPVVFVMVYPVSGAVGVEALIMYACNTLSGKGSTSLLLLFAWAGNGSISAGYPVVFATSWFTQ